MERLSERQRIELSLIWALALLLLYVLVLSPLFAAQRTAIHAERIVLRAQNARVDAYQQNLLRDGQVEEKLHVRYARALEALPEEGRQGSFMHGIERLAVRSGVVIEGFAPQPPQTIEGIWIQPIELRFRGNYFDVLSFLHSIQEAERCVVFGDFSISAEGDELHCAVQVKIAARGAETDQIDGRAAAMQEKPQTQRI